MGNNVCYSVSKSVLGDNIHGGYGQTNPATDHRDKILLLSIILFFAALGGASYWFHSSLIAWIGVALFAGFHFLCLGIFMMNKCISDREQTEEKYKMHWIDFPKGIRDMYQEIWRVLRS